MANWLDENWIGQTVHQLSGVFWRAVEAQHVVATMRLVDSLHEQALLEQILEASKPSLARGHTVLHFLLTAPFRYTSPSPSRFRPADAPGIWYGAHDIRTACAEVGYWRWRFLMESAGLRDGNLVTEHTLFQAKVAGSCIDLAANPWSRLQDKWTHKTDYASCHELASAARGDRVPSATGAAAITLQWIRYLSVRAPGGQCAAVMDALALELHEPTRQETWVGKVTASQVMFTHGVDGFTFMARDWD